MGEQRTLYNESLRLWTIFMLLCAPKGHDGSSENPCCLSNISHILGSLITYLKKSLMVKWPVERLKVSSACSWHIPLFLKPARSGSPSGSLTTSKFRPYDLPFPKFSLTLYQKHKCFPLCCLLCE